MGENTSLGDKFGRGKSNTRKNYGSETNSIARKGSRGKFPLAGSRGDFVPFRLSLVGFGATPQLFFGRSIQREQPTKAQAAKRPCQ